MGDSLDRASLGAKSAPTAATLAPSLLGRRIVAEEHQRSECCGLTYASPEAAMRSPRETLVYVPGIYVGTPVNKPDYLATVDVDPGSDSPAGDALRG